MDQKKQSPKGIMPAGLKRAILDASLFSNIHVRVTDISNSYTPLIIKWRGREYELSAIQRINTNG